MSIFSLLSQKPWMADQAAIDDNHIGRSSSHPLPRVALYVLMAVIGVLFSLFSVAYIGRMAYGDWRILPEPTLLWFNTGVIMLSSFAFSRATINAREGDIKRTREYLLLAGVLTFGFIIGQLFVWRELVSFGYFVSTNPSYAFFYLLTALHILHLFGGLIAWLVVTYKSFIPQKETSDFSLKVNLCAIYWHFLLIVWTLLFVMLLLT
ncbi:MAG: cytochrome c oxidase subunit 3 [Alphaproteobacteria bacterium]|nr:alternative cytochrome c oxidase polypeptide CoxN [Rhodobiaceae bacterium]MDC0070876.1 cytochrome c oxidase subunit 3 [Rhodobiaceae bacterium]MDC0184558.1 cytochrome c oxidase subunit 3 [Rhodobiaceae bacterium]